MPASIALPRSVFGVIQARRKTEDKSDRYEFLHDGMSGDVVGLLLNVKFRHNWFSSFRDGRVEICPLSFFWPLAYRLCNNLSYRRLCWRNHGPVLMLIVVLILKDS